MKRAFWDKGVQGFRCCYCESLPYVTNPWGLKLEVVSWFPTHKATPWTLQSWRHADSGVRNLPFILPTISWRYPSSLLCSATSSSSRLANALLFRCPFPPQRSAFYILFTCCLCYCLALVFVGCFFFFRVASSRTGQFNEPGAVAAAVSQVPRAKYYGTGKAASHPRAWSCLIQLPAKAQSLAIDNKSNTNTFIIHLLWIPKLYRMTLFSQIKALQSASLQQALASFPLDTHVPTKDVWASPRVNGAETTGTAGNNT